MRIDEINKNLEKISDKQNKLFEEERKLMEEKNSLISKEVIESKILTKTKWSLENYSSYRNSSDDEFTLKAILKHELDDLQTQLDLWYHDDFDLAEDVRLITDDGDFLIHANSIVAGIKFIKLSGIEIDTSGIDEQVLSLRKKADSIQEFIDKICKKE